MIRALTKDGQCKLRFDIQQVSVSRRFVNFDFEFRSSSVQIPLGSSRHVSTRHDTYDVSCVSRCACPSMADDEEAVVVPCTTLVFVLWICINLTNSFCPPQSTLWRCPWTRVVRVALVVTSVSRPAVRHALHVTTFPYAKKHGLDSVSWRNVSWPAMWNLGFSGRLLVAGVYSRSTFLA